MPKLYGGDVVYKYEELDSFAQDRALAKWAEEEYLHDADDNGEYERESIAEVFQSLGFDVKRQYFRTIGGQTRSSPDFYFDNEHGGDFVWAAYYEYQKGWKKAYEKVGYRRTEEDTTILELGLRLQEMQRKYFYALVGRVADESQRVGETGYTFFRSPPIYIRHMNDEYFEESTVYEAIQEEFTDIVLHLGRWAWDILNDRYEWVGSKRKALGEDGESGDIEDNRIYFSEDGTELYYDVADEELEEYTEDEENEEDN